MTFTSQRGKRKAAGGVSSVIKQQSVTFVSRVYGLIAHPLIPPIRTVRILRSAIFGGVCDVFKDDLRNPSLPV